MSKWGKIRVRLKSDDGHEYAVSMLSEGPIRGGTVAFGHFNDDGRFRYQWDYGLPYDFPEDEVAKAIDAALAAGPQYDTMYGDHYATPRR
jgi:hypothetical protein